MKRTRMFPLLVLAGSTLLAAPLVRAQSVGQAIGQALGSFFGTQNETASEAQLRSFNHFLRDNPDAARDIRRMPSLVTNRDYVQHHQALRDWMGDHPEAASALRENPDGFMDRERHFESYENDFSSGDTRRGELAHFDWFLDSHPDVRNDLMRRPELAQRDDYLDHHQQLRDFLGRHPVVRDQLRNDPRGFMDREARLENRQAQNGNQNGNYPNNNPNHYDQDRDRDYNNR